MLHLLLYASPCFHDPMWIPQRSEYHDQIPSHVSKEPRPHDHYHSFLLLLQIQPINSISPSFSPWIAILLPCSIAQSHDLPPLEIPDDPKCVHNIFQENHKNHKLILVFQKSPLEKKKKIINHLPFLPISPYLSPHIFLLLANGH